MLMVVVSVRPAPWGAQQRGSRRGGLTWSCSARNGRRRYVFPRFTPDAVTAHLDLVRAVRTVAARLDATPGQVALAWLLAQKPWIVPIPGTRRLERIRENAAAADVELSADDLAELDRVAAENQVQGDRYPEHMQRLIDR
jgi:aryl-alcohol dehydrogenase-like predicted oxidoreductase